MITFSAADHTTFETAANTLFVQAPSDHPVARSLAQAVATADGTFRSLAQVVVENGFEAPAFVCIRREDENLHLFLFGSVKAHVAPPAEATLDGTGTSTWTEHTVPAGVEVSIEWTVAQIPIVDSAADETSESEQTSVEPRPSATVPPLRTAPPEPTHESNSAVPPAPSVEQAPWKPPTFDPTSQPQSPGPPPGSPPSRPVPTPDPTASLPTRGDSEETSLVDAHRQSPETPTETERFVAQSAPVLDTPSLDGDVTLDADEFRRSQTEPTPAPPGSSSPLVTARVCPCGAPSPLGAEVCISCGSSLRREGVSIAQVPRPPIGTLVLDDGTRIPLEDSLVLGRNVPEAFEIGGRVYPGVSIDSPTKQLSKVHLEVRLVDWTVNVIDLDSANGTYIENSEGRPAKRLRPNVVEQVLPGDSVQFGDRSFVFEATPGL